MNAEREPLAVLQAGLNEQYESEDGERFELQLGPGLSEAQLDELRLRLPGPIPPEITALLRCCASVDFPPLETIDFTGQLSFEQPELFPYGLPIAGDGIGNFWVVDVAEDGSWGPIFFACHDPPVALIQAPNLASFLADALLLGQPDRPSQIYEMSGTPVMSIWRGNPDLISVQEARRTANEDLRIFAESLSDEFEICDLRPRVAGSGFSWGRAGANTKLRRFGTKLLFAIEKPLPLRSRLLGRW